MTDIFQQVTEYQGRLCTFHLESGAKLKLSLCDRNGNVAFSRYWEQFFAASVHKPITEMTGNSGTLLAQYLLGFERLVGIW